MLQKLTLLALAGALGTLARYGLAGGVQKIYGTPSPWGTFAVNIIGCFLAGLLWALFEGRWQVSAETKTVLLVGFMGAFTTFSAFILESSELARSATWMNAAANVALQTGLGFLALFIGAALARTV